MADGTHIQWTDATWNIITGCTLVDEGCRNCYAAGLAATRLKNHPSRAGLARLNAQGVAKFTGEVRFNEGWLDQPLRWSKPRMIFVCAHGDLFHENVPDEWIDKVFAVMALASQHTFQVLTKRPERARAYLTALQDRALSEPIAEIYVDHPELAKRTPLNRRLAIASTIRPLPNVWLGTSVSDQASAEARIPDLLAAPAAVRFISAEPLLGPLDLRRVPVGSGWVDALDLLDWVIVGGESGAKARPMHPDWAESLLDQCQRAGVAFFFKQWGEWHTGSILGTTGEPVFRQFRDFTHWVNKAPTWVRGGICIDAAGRQCAIGSDFMRARDEGTFPITIMDRVGKARAGRRLRGREWNEMPGAR